MNKILQFILRRNQRIEDRKARNRGEEPEIRINLYEQDENRLDYDPDQPRAPKGKKNGGQFVKEGSVGGEGTGEETTAEPKGSEKGNVASRKEKSIGRARKNYSSSESTTAEKKESKSENKKQQQKKYILDGSRIYDYTRKKVTDAINAGIAKIQDPYVKWVSRVAISSAKFSNDAYENHRAGDLYNSITGEVYLTHRSRRGRENTVPGEAAAHECFHSYDYRTLDGQRTLYPFSEHYENGKLRKTLRREIEDFLKTRGDPTLERDFTFDDFKNMDKESKDLMRQLIIEELESLGFKASDMCDFSDMIDAATGGEFHLRAHHEEGYFQQDEFSDEQDVNDLISSEAFAEFGAAYTVNSGSLKLLQMFCPESCEVFEEMCTFRYLNRKK